MGFICFCILAIILFLFPIRQPIVLEDMLTGLIVCLFGSLAPDLDHKHSKIHKWSYAGSLFSGFFIYLFMREIRMALAITALLLFIVFLLSRLKHRGITHHAPGFIIFTVLLFIAFYSMNFASPVIITMLGAVGYLSHLAADYII